MELNQEACTYVVGTKFDKYVSFTDTKKQQITNRAAKFAEAINSPLVFCSSYTGVNVTKLFAMILSDAFGLISGIEQVDDPTQPVIYIPSTVE